MKKQWASALGILIVSGILVGCSAQTSQPSGTENQNMTQEQQNTNAGGSTTTSRVKKIDAAQAKKMMDESTVTIVDVRRADEYATGHIKDAINVANESIGTAPIAALPDKNATLLIYCRTGIRSADASSKLEALGYQNIYDMGGIVDWPYGTVK